MSEDTPDTTAVSACRQQSMDRRERRRFLAQWDVQISTLMRDIIHARTVDVSSGGFYCRSPRPLLTGERVKAFLHMPEIGEQDSKFVIRCDVYVLRVDPSIDHGWGIACQILDYSIFRDLNRRLQMEMMETD